jgi:hypothetical protein
MIDLLFAILRCPGRRLDRLLFGCTPKSAKVRFSRARPAATVDTCPSLIQKADTRGNACSRETPLSE